MNVYGTMSSEALMPKYSSNPTAFGPLAMGRVKSTFQPSAPFSMASVNLGLSGFSAQSMPRCHLPMAVVRYPARRSSSATVRRPGSISRGLQPPSTPDWSRDRQAYRPVRMPYRVGEQTAEPECASVKTIPAAASRSRFGVAILPAGFKHRTSP